MGGKDKQKTNWGRKTITTSRQKWGEEEGPREEEEEKGRRRKKRRSIKRGNVPPSALIWLCMGMAKLR